MRKELLVFAILLTVGVITNANVPDPAIDSGVKVVAPTAEVLPAACAVATEAVQAEFDLASWLEQQAQAVCSAEPDDDAFLFVARRIGQSCGGNTCGKFQYCCNPSCGTCVYYGMSCTQQSCN